jgi:hypothetical protein
MPENPERNGGIEIPERPAVASEAAAGGRLRRRVLIWGGIAAAALVMLAVLASVFSGHGERVAREASDAPLIKGEEQPMKVAPDSPGGMQVPNRDMLVYERMHGSPGAAPPVERLLPEPEQPIMPPQPKPAAPPAEPPLLAPPRDKAVAGAEQLSPSHTPSSPPGAAAPTESWAQPPADVPSNPPTVVAPAPAVPPSPPPPAKVSVPEKPAAPAKPAKSATGSYQIQLLAGRNEDDVRSAWTKLKARNADVLGSLSPVLAPTRLGDRGTYYRLRAGPLESEAKARAVCDRLSSRGASCIVIRPGR